MFLTELHTKYVGHGISRVTKLFKYHSEIIGLVTVRAGFDTDFASIPRLLRWVITGSDNTKPGAVVHDYLYRHKPKGIDRKTADKVFLEVMRDSSKPEWQVSRWKASMAYAGVRIGGWVSWSGYGNTKKN